jgi:hypothetical protein
MCSRHTIVAVKINVVERRGKSIPPRHAAFLNAHHVRRCSQPDAPASHRPLHQRHRKFNSRSGLNRARSKKKDSARADIFRHQRHRLGFRISRHADQLQGQTQARSGAAPPVFHHADRMRRHPQKRSMRQACWNSRQSRRGFNRCFYQMHFRKRPHVPSPKTWPSTSQAQKICT